MGRKTVDVTKVVEWTNHYLASDMTEPVDRLAVASLCETILHSTDNYAGFSYLASEYLPVEEQVGNKVLRDGFDDSRRAYSTRKIGK